MTRTGKLLVALVVAIVIGGASALLFWPSGNQTKPTTVGNGVGSGNDSGLASASSNEGSPKMSSSESNSDRDKTFEQIKIEAEQGSAKAQRKLSEIYALCAGYSLDSKKQLATLDGLAGLVPASKSGIDRVKQRLKTRCDKVDFGQPIPSDAINLWMEQAAKNGDVAAKIKVRTRSAQPLSAEEANELLEEALGTGDPDALMEMSNLMSRSVAGELPDRYQQMAGDSTVGAAWGIAACRAGASCANDSMLMDSICMSTGRCGYRTYEEFLTSEVVSPAERARMNSVANSILRMTAR